MRRILRSSCWVGIREYVFGAYCAPAAHLRLMERLLFPRVTDEAPEAEGWLIWVRRVTSEPQSWVLSPVWLLSLHSSDDHIRELGSGLSQGCFRGSYWATHLKTLRLGLLTCKLVILLFPSSLEALYVKQDACIGMLSKFIKHYKL